MSGNLLSHFWVGRSNIRGHIQHRGDPHLLPTHTCNDSGPTILTFPCTALSVQDRPDMDVSDKTGDAFLGQKVIWIINSIQGGGYSNNDNVIPNFS